MKKEYDLNAYIEFTKLIKKAEKVTRNLCDLYRSDYDSANIEQPMAPSIPEYYIHDFKSIKKVL
mgnify:CR=1 FL=1